MAAVSVNQGMPGPEESVHKVDRSRWQLLAMARRQWAEIDLPHDCRLLRTVVDEAPLLAEGLGMESGNQFLTDYLSLDLDLVGRVLGWLEQEQPTEAVPLQLVIEQAKAQPLAANGAIGNGRSFDNVKATEGGNCQSYLLRRIARDQPELLDQIGPGKPHRSARAAAIAAGIIKPVPTVRLVDDVEKVADSICRHLTTGQQVALATAIAQRVRDGPGHHPSGTTPPAL